MGSARLPHYPGVWRADKRNSRNPRSGWILMATFRMVVILMAVLGALACASGPTRGPKWQGTSGVVETTQATVIVDGKPTTVRVVCSRGC